MPAQPTWDQVEQIAAQMHNAKKGRVGICLRGDPGWGENLAPIDTVINSFGGRWFNPAWRAQMTSPEVTRALDTYVRVVQKYGEPGAPVEGVAIVTGTVAAGILAHVLGIVAVLSVQGAGYVAAGVLVLALLQAPHRFAAATK